MNVDLKEYFRIFVGVLLREIKKGDKREIKAHFRKVFKNIIVACHLL